MSLDHILLGLLREPQSGYDLKAFFDRSLQYFWPAELSQIYRNLKRLERTGMLQSKSKTSKIGPDRKVYSITKTGRQELKSWLSDRPQFGDERFSYLAQVFFMDECHDISATEEFIREMRSEFKERITTYRKIDKEWRNCNSHYPALESESGFHMHLTLRMGMHRMTASVKWCDESLAAIQERQKEKMISPNKTG